MRFVFVFLAFFVLATQSSTAKSDIVWTFNSNDGTNFLTGQLTTNGVLADLAVDNEFDLLSFDAVTIQILPGLPDDLDSDSDWTGGSAPPFTSFADGSILWDTDTATAEISGNFMFAGTPTISDYVQLGRVGAGVFSDTGFDPGTGDRYLQFIPGSNTFTPVAIPEPSTFLVLALGCAGMFGCRRRLRLF